ncbi:hypothetical protein ACFX14_043030 [Malus domestica]
MAILYIDTWQQSNNIILYTLTFSPQAHPSWQEKAKEDVLRLRGKNTPDLAHLPENQYRRAFHPSCCGRFVFPTLILHTDPKYRGGDVEEFKPERFAEGVAHGFSVIKAKMAPVMILQHFTVELSPSYIHCPVMYITVQPHHGTPVIQHRI